MITLRIDQVFDEWIADELQRAYLLRKPLTLRITRLEAHRIEDTGEYHLTIDLLQEGPTS